MSTYNINKIKLPNGDICDISPTWENIKSKPTISSPSPNGTGVSFIDTITQTNGTISATKKTVPNATTSENGLMLSNDKEKLDSIDLIKQVKTINIEPVQDLHGYDHPWPEGGGKNILPLTVDAIKARNTSGTWNGNTYTKNGVSFELILNAGGAVEGIKANGTASSEATIDVSISFVAGTYILNGAPATGSMNTYEIQCYITRTNRDYGNGVQFTVAEDLFRTVSIIIRGGYTASNLLFKPMIRFATETDPTFAPYSNICPITGWTGATIQHTGNNIVDFDKSFICNTDILKGTEIKISKGTRVYFQRKGGISSQLYGRKKDGSMFGIAQIEETKSSATLAFDITAIGISTNARTAYGENDILMVSLTDFTELSSYSGETIPISWQSEAGTVYGGTLDVTTGVLTVDRAMATINGNTSWGVNGSIGYVVTSTYWGGDKCIRASSAQTPADSNMFVNSGNTWADGYFGIENRTIWVTDRNFNIFGGLDGFKTALNTNPLQIVYPLATPQTYQLTPTQILLLEEHDHVWADCGDITLQSCFTNNAANVTGIVAIEHGGTGSAITGVNTVFAGPSSGATNAAPNFRSLVSADIPTLSITNKTSGTLTVPRGGTGATTAADARTNLGLGSMATETAADYLKLSGGTMTNSLTITKTGECGVEVNNTNDTRPNQVAFLVGASGNGGIYSRKHTKWIVYSDINGNVVLNGNATTATTASKLSNTSAIGDATRPVYFTNNGLPSQTTYRMSGTNTTATTSISITTDLPTGNWYVSGTADIYSQGDGVVYAEQYNSSWIHEIYGDYRTGQIAVRGKNSGTWQAWRKVLDSSNWKTLIGATTAAASATKYLREDGSWQVPVDTKNTAGSTNSASKLFLIGATTRAANPTTNSYEYTYTDNGLLSALKLGLNLNGTEKAHLEWNNTDQSIDFIFN